MLPGQVTPQLSSRVCGRTKRPVCCFTLTYERGSMLPRCWSRWGPVCAAVACVLGAALLAACDSATEPGDHAPTISPLALAASGRDSHTGAMILVAFRADSSFVDTIAVEGRNASIVTLAWHPDHRQLAFSRGDSVIALDADGGNRRALFREPGQVFSPVSWSPDGRQIAFGACRDQTYECRIAIRDVAADAPARTLVSGSVYSPSWSPKGDRIAYLQFQLATGSWTLMSIRVDGTDARELVARSDFVAERPAWSPLGDRIAFVTGSYETRQLRILEVSGGTTTLAGGGPAGTTFHYPAWSPDGRRIGVLHSTDSAATKRPVLLDVARGTITSTDGPSRLETLTW